MKKFKVKVILKNGEPKMSYVYLEDKVADMLLQTGDKELLRQYLLEEYRTSRVERTETRRRQSLDDDMENGIDYEDKQGRQLPFSFSDIEDNSLFEAIQQLTPRQKEMLHLVYFEDKTQDEVASYYGVSKSAISHAMERIYTAIKKYIEKN